MTWRTRQQANAAARREQELVRAIAQRGHEHGMEPDRVSAAIGAARAQIRARGESYEQILGDLPVDPMECCGDCYEQFTANDDTDGM